MAAHVGEPFQQERPQKLALRKQKRLLFLNLEDGVMWFLFRNDEQIQLFKSLEDGVGFDLEDLYN